MADPQKYRDEAELLRQQAVKSPDCDVRGTMIEVADLYDRLADTLARKGHQPDAIEKTQPVSKGQQLSPPISPTRGDGRAQ